MWVNKFFGPDKFWVRKKCFKKDFDPPKISVLKFFFGKKIGFEMTLCLKNVGFETNFASNEIAGPKSLVKIGAVTGEKLMIWTNVARAYVAWTNVTVTVG